MPLDAHDPYFRLWTPIGSTSRSNGFAVEAVDWFRQFITPETKRLDELAEVRCLFLLGEPGMGKSRVLRSEVDRLRANPHPGILIHQVDLAEVSSDAGLDGVFADPALKSWRSGGDTLALFLDSYDECLRRYRNLKARLLTKLRRQPLDRLRLRIACRAGDFPGHLPAELAQIWPSLLTDESIDIRTYVLEPLARSAVYSWAEASEINGTAFVAEIDRHNARSFAARPITLTQLIS